MPIKKTPAKKTAKEKPVIEQVVEQVEQETFEEAFERVVQVEQEAIAQPESQQLMLAEEQAILFRRETIPPVPCRKPKSNTISIWSLSAA